MEDGIPRIKNAVLVDQILVKLDVEMGQEIRELKSRHKVDVHELVRSFLRHELPKIKAKLNA